MFKLISNNWGAKVICLILAVGLWTYVAVGESKVDNFPGKIPLTIKNTPNNMVAITDVDTVQIKVSADRAVWQRLSANSFEVYIDLNGLNQGTHEVDVSARSNIANVDIVQIMPQKVLVRLEPLAKKNVPVKVQTTGQAADGLVSGDANIDPENVEISGAQSIIDKILEVTASIQLNGESAQIEKTISVAALDAQGEEIRNISYSPSDIKVTLPIVKAGTTKTVGIKTKMSGNPKSGYWINQISVVPSDITIRGNSGVLRGINYIETKAIDVEGISDGITKNIDLDLPSGVTLADATNSQVKVTITLSSISSEKEIIAGLIYDNTASGLKVDSVDPSTIKILTSGPADLLNTLSSNNVQIHLDLASYHSAGNYSIDITRSMINAPDGISVSSFVPSSIRVILANK